MKKESKLNVTTTKHSIQQKINREVKSIDELQALKKPLTKSEIKFDINGRPSEKYIGDKATVVINPTNNKIITVYPTSSKIVEKLIKEKK